MKYYYTVIVGTQPGVYADWSQAAPTVTGISGAIHKKYKTYREAREAFDRAGREGRVQVIQVDPQPDDCGAPAPISAAPFLSVVPDQRDFHQNAQYPQHAPPACAAGCYACPHATRSMRKEPGNASRNSSSPASAHNVDLGASIGARPLGRTTSEYHGNTGQPSRTIFGYADSSGSPSALSSPSGPAGRSLVHEHADLPSSGFSIWQGENWQNNEQGYVALPGSSRVRSTAAQHREAGATGTSAEMGQRTRESPSSTLLQPVRSGHLTYRIPGESQDEDTPWTAARTHRQLLPVDPASDARVTIGEGQSAQNRVLNFLSRLGRARSQGDSGNRRRPSLQSVDTLDSSDGMQRIQSSHTQLQATAESPSSLGAPNLSRPPSSCSHISSASFRSTLSFYVELTEAETSEEPENVASSTPPPTPPFFAPSSLVVYGPSTLDQDDLHEGDREEATPSGEQRLTSSGLSGNRRSAPGVPSPVEHMPSQFDHPNSGADTLPRSLSPLLVASTLPTPNHLWTQNIRRSPAETPASSPHEVWPTSPLSHFSFELAPSTDNGLGLLTGVASPRLYPLPQSPAAQNFPESPVNQSVRGTDAQSPTNSSRDTPQRGYASSQHLGAATPEDTQSVRARPADYGSQSHHNTPLSPSPASNSITRLQLQPAHRNSPRRSLYPSLASEDPELPGPSSLNVVFGLPTPGMSPIQTPAVIRSPAMDPRSPVPSQMRIPGDIMGVVYFGRPTPPTNTRMFH